MASEPKPPSPPPATYAVGYGKPPKASQFKPGVSGNPKGKPKGQPSFGEILLQEAARIVKVKIGDEIVQVPKQRALVRKLLDMAMQGDIAAARLILHQTQLAQADAEAAPPPELPLTPEEFAIAAIIAKQAGAP